VSSEAPVSVIEMPTFAAAARKLKLPDTEFFEIADYLSRSRRRD
jgi:hypothetical protein